MRQLSVAAHSDAPLATSRIQKANVPHRRARTRVGLPQRTWEARITLPNLREDSSLH
jgi:hypothetical protein